jgi:hypothetical protein
MIFEGSPASLIIHYIRRYLTLVLSYANKYNTFVGQLDLW